MIFDMSRQVTLFIYSILSGILIGVLFDIYRIIRGVEEPGKIVTAIEDLLFWILTAIIIFVFMMYTNYAYLSFNIFVYIAMGIFLHFKLFSKTFIKILNSVLKYVFSLLRMIFYHIFYPFRIIFQKITKKEKKKVQNNDISTWRKYKYKLKYSYRLIIVDKHVFLLLWGGSDELWKN